MTDDVVADFAEIEKRFMPIVMDKVRKKAAEIASEAGKSEANYIDTFHAFDLVLGDRPAESNAPKSTSWYVLSKEGVFLFIVAFMTIAFGIMGLVPYIFGIDATKLGYKADVFLDIAKLFAGVLVGGAAGAAAGSTSKR